MTNELIARSERVSAEVRAEMAKRRVSVNALAEEVGIPVSTLRRSVNGQRSFTLDELFAVLQALKTPVSELIARTEEGGAPEFAEQRAS